MISSEVLLSSAPVGSSASSSRRIVDERARDGDALLLAARELLRAMLQAVAEPDLLEPHSGRRFRQSRGRGLA